MAPSRLVECHQCDDRRRRLRAALVCREDEDTPKHVLCCPALMDTRHRLLGTICLEMEEVRSGDIVGALGAAHRSLQSRSSTSQ